MTYNQTTKKESLAFLETTNVCVVFNIYSTIQKPLQYGRVAQQSIIHNHRCSCRQVVLSAFLGVLIHHGFIEFDWGFAERTTPLTLHQPRLDALQMKSVQTSRQNSNFFSFFKIIDTNGTHGARN